MKQNRIKSKNHSRHKLSLRSRELMPRRINYTLRFRKSEIKAMFSYVTKQDKACQLRALAMR